MILCFCGKKKGKLLSYVTHERSTAHLGYDTFIISFTFKHVSENWSNLCVEINVEHYEVSCHN